MNDEFYIGWQDKSPPGVGKTVRRAVLLLLALAVLVPLMLAGAQRLIGRSVFEWGNRKMFSGILQITPYPHLLVRRPGQAGEQAKFSTYYLVAPWKFGLDREKLAPFAGEAVQLEGTLIYRGDQTMIEVQPDSVRKNSGTNAAVTAAFPVEPLGRQTLTGEIVDSKCFLGVMNPGQLTPHRACAIRCISGGIPPVLLVRQQNGPPLYFLLVSATGQPVNRQVLDLVAEPVEITGDVERQDGLLILRAAPATYRRL